MMFNIIENKDKDIYDITIDPGHGGMDGGGASGDYKETTKLSMEHVEFNRELIENWIQTHKKDFDNNLLIKNATKETIREILSEYKYGNYNKLNDTVVSEVLKEFDKFKNEESIIPIYRGMWWDTDSFYMDKVKKWKLEKNKIIKYSSENPISFSTNYIIAQKY